jgi:hypothetical protein
MKMNHYYKTSFHSAGFVAVRVNGTKYQEPGERVSANSTLKKAARLGCIPTLYPTSTGLSYI